MTTIAELNYQRKLAGLPLIRFDVLRLQLEDIQDLRDAYAAMYEISDTAIGDSRGYTALARSHGYDQDLCHNDSRIFLTWHRSYIYAFEKALSSALRWTRGNDELELTLPYWDWTVFNTATHAASGIPKVLDDATYVNADGATVDSYGLTGNERSRGGNEKSRHGRHVFRRAPATQRGFGNCPFLPDVRRLFAPGGSRPPGSQTIDPHLGGERNGQTAREGHHGALDGPEEFAAVAAHAGVGLIPSNIQDDAAAGLLHVGTDASGKSNRGPHVHAPEQLELFIEVQRRGLAGEYVGPRVVHPNIDPVVLGQRIVNESIARFGNRQILHQDPAAAPAFRHLRGDLLTQRAGLTAVDQHVRPGLGQGQRGGSSDPAARTGNDRHLSGQRLVRNRRGCHSGEYTTRPGRRHPERGT